MEYLKERLLPGFYQETDHGFRASLRTNHDVAVFCVSPYSTEDTNKNWAYVVQVLSKNNTIVAQTRFEDIEIALDALNNHSLS